MRWSRKAYSLDPENPQTNTAIAYLYWDLGDDGQAECWAYRAMELAPESFYSIEVMQFVSLQRGNETQALEYAHKALKIQPGWRKAYSLATLLNHDLRTGRYTETRNRYEKSFPELFAEDKPKIGALNYWAAIGLTAVLQKTNEQERGNWLLNSSLKYIQDIPRLGFFGYGLSDVRIYALQGETQKVLTTLRQAIDEGWRYMWRYYLEHDPNLESIRHEPEFQAMLAEIKADMAEQLARVREMEKEGDMCVGS